MKLLQVIPQLESKEMHRYEIVISHTNAVSYTFSILPYFIVGWKLGQNIKGEKSTKKMGGERTTTKTRAISLPLLVDLFVCSLGAHFIFVLFQVFRKHFLCWPFFDLFYWFHFALLLWSQINSIFGSKIDKNGWIANENWTMKKYNYDWYRFFCNFIVTEQRDILTSVQHSVILIFCQWKSFICLTCVIICVW